MSRRTVLWIVGAVVAVNAVLWLIDTLAPGPSGKPSSSLATTPRGFAAWAELAKRNGHPVVALRDQLRDAKLPAGGTVVALDVPSLSLPDARALRAYAAGTGHVVVGGRLPLRWLDVFDEQLRWVSSGPKAATVGDRHLEGAGRGAWSPGGLVLQRRSVTLLADSSPLQNARLARADNAAFALDLVGGGSGPLIFAESAHGYGTARGLAALPDGAKAALALLLAAALLYALARGKRFGPVEADARPLAPRRVEYVDAMAELLERADRR